MEVIPKKVDGDVKGICSFYRESEKSYTIVDYLQERITKIVGYKPNFNTDQAHNLWFDLPASKGYENKPAVVIQGHTDMVLDYVNEQAREEAIESGIKPEIDNGYVHSLNNKTSLGADNGAGVAIALAMLKNHKKFNHGLVRFVFSADEETGCIGANYAFENNEKLFVDDNGKSIDYLINVDAEPKYSIYRSCAGGFDAVYEATLDSSEEELLANKFELYIDGLAGGHSGNDMELMRFNADRLIFEFLNAIIDDGGAVQIISYDHQDPTTGEDFEWKLNQIVKSGHVTFITDLAEARLNEIFNNLITNKWSNKYIGEDWGNVTHTLSPYVLQSGDHYLSAENSSKIIKFVGSNDNVDDLSKGLVYGVYDWIGEGIARRPKASLNIAPFSIKKLVGSSNISISLESYARETDEQWLATHKITYSNAWNALFGNQSFIKSSFLPWSAKEPNTFGDLVMKHYKNQGVEAWYRDSRGGVEPAIWTHMNDNLQCVCIGPEIRNPHTVDEILTIDTILPVYNTIVDVLKEI